MQSLAAASTTTSPPSKSSLLLFLFLFLFLLLLALPLASARAPPAASAGGGGAAWRSSRPSPPKKEDAPTSSDKNVVSSPSWRDRQLLDGGEESWCSTVNLLDSFGDGWTGDAVLFFTSVDTGYVLLPGLKLPEGSSSAEPLCFGCGCYIGQATAGDYPDEMSWNVQDSSGATLASAKKTKQSKSFCPMSMSCFSCPVGSLSNSAGTACEPCPAGKYNDVEGLNLACAACGAGKYNADAGSTSDSACVACATGSYGPPGSSSASSCELCEAGKYGDVEPVEVCTDCSAGKYNADAGSTSDAACVACATGYYSASSGASSASSCVPGSSRYTALNLKRIGDIGETWTSARAICIARSSDLVSIQSPEELSIVVGLCDGDTTWIGANDVDSEGTWVWSDGTPFTYSGFWATGEPNDWGSNEDCGHHRRLCKS